MQCSIGVAVDWVMSVSCAGLLGMQESIKFHQKIDDVELTIIVAEVK